MISLHDIASRCCSRAELYDLMLRNGYVMPSVNSSIVTIEFMFKVKAGDIWCPQTKNISG